jgi:hypothetical protein
MITMVARPRRQPRRASLATPGSIARDKNNDTNAMINSDDSREYAYRKRMVARKPNQKTKVAFHTQRGIRSELGFGAWDSSAM